MFAEVAFTKANWTAPGADFLHEGVNVFRKAQNSYSVELFNPSNGTVPVESVVLEKTSALVLSKTRTWTEGNGLSEESVTETTAAAPCFDSVTSV
ncbi:MAG TPA: hypothetical protein VJA40_02190, partial [archaeon]|nr:hypothetical protein [archaeon]